MVVPSDSCYKQFNWHETFSLNIKSCSVSAQLLWQLNIPLILPFSEVLSLFIATDLLIYCTSKGYLHTHTWKSVNKLNQSNFKALIQLSHSEPTLGYFHFAHFSVTSLQTCQDMQSISILFPTLFISSAPISILFLFIVLSVLKKSVLCNMSQMFFCLLSFTLLLMILCCAVLKRKFT